MKKSLSMHMRFTSKDPDPLPEDFGETKVVMLGEASDGMLAFLEGRESNVKDARPPGAGAVDAKGFSSFEF